MQFVVDQTEESAQNDHMLVHYVKSNVTKL